MGARSRGAGRLALHQRGVAWPPPRPRTRRGARVRPSVGRGANPRPTGVEHHVLVVEDQTLAQSRRPGATCEARPRAACGTRRRDAAGSPRRWRGWPRRAPGGDDMRARGGLRHGEKTDFSRRPATPPPSPPPLLSPLPHTLEPRPLLSLFHPPPPLSPPLLSAFLPSPPAARTAHSNHGSPPFHPPPPLSLSATPPPSPPRARVAFLLPLSPITRRRCPPLRRGDDSHTP